MDTNKPDTSERRQSPRYEVKLPFDMVLENGTILSVETRNISSCGLQMVCDSWITDEIEPRGIQNHAISHIRLKSIIELPSLEKDNNSDVKKLYANCKIMSVQRMSQQVYMLNLTFIDFENGSDRSLDDFLEQYEQKKTINNATA